MTLLQSEPKAIKIWTTNVNAVYLWTTKVRPTTPSWPETYILDISQTQTDVVMFQWWNSPTTLEVEYDISAFPARENVDVKTGSSWNNTRFPLSQNMSNLEVANTYSISLNQTSPVKLRWTVTYTFATTTISWDLHASPDWRMWVRITWSDVPSYEFPYSYIWDFSQDMIVNHTPMSRSPWTGTMTFKLYR